MRALRVVRPALRLLLAVGLAAASVATAPSAAASCAWPPAQSPHAFAGTVVETRADDRIATVITDEGRRVTVLGTSGTGWLSGSATSVDRRYVLGARYEFHPTNATDPYRDNACTATHRLAGPNPEPVEPADDVLPGGLPVDEQAGPVGYAVFLAPVVAVGLGLALAVRWGRRRLSTSE